jgi:hypothetical protein
LPTSEPGPTGPRRVSPASVRSTVIVAAAITVLALAAAPAHAHPDEGIVATNYRAEITEIEPDPGVLDLRVAGGDSWIEMHVGPGHEVVVYGYGERDRPPEPYVRVDADGSVHLNGNSPATWMNEDRYGQVDIPDWVDPSAEPRWQVIAVAGTHYAEWHDHRTHWMSPEPPRQVRQDPGSTHDMFVWEVPLRVDGEEVMIRGTLRYLPGTSPLWPVAIGLFAAAAAFLVSRDGRDRQASLVATIASAAALAVATGAFTHPDAATGWTGLIFPAVAILAAGAGFAPRPRIGAGGVIVAAIALTSWALPLLPSTIRPIVFSTLPRPLIVVLIPLALGLALGAGAATFTDLPDAEDARPRDTEAIA